MATGQLQWGVGAATPPEGAASSVMAGFARILGTETAPKKSILVATFDPGTAEHLVFPFRAPVDYASGGTVKLLWMANATANSVVWGARIGAVTPTDADTPVEHAQATAVTATTAVNATEARRLIETSIDLTGNLDSVAAGDLADLIVYRDAANGSDTCTVDAELVVVAFEYTTA